MDQFLPENVLFEQKIWREVDVKEASLECDSNSVDLPGSLVIPKLKCGIFASNTADKLSFKKFLVHSENLVSGVKSGICELRILRSYPAQVIEHLSVSDENYFVLLDLLRSEFLDLDFIQFKYFQKFCLTSLKQV